MIIDRHQIKEYPFTGAFYNKIIDKTKPRKEWKEEEVLVLETVCDIQESKRSNSGVISDSFDVYFPFDTTKNMEIHRGMIFKGRMYGLFVDGMVLSVFPTQLGGCHVYITDYTNGDEAAK